jgi:hypothetical protein
VSLEQEPEITLEQALACMKSLGPKGFNIAFGLLLWAADGCEKYELELAYQDDEVMLFRRKVPLSEQLKKAAEGGPTGPEGEKR